MPPGLLEAGQSDFSAGWWLSVAQHKIPANGAADLLNVLLDDDGQAYRRGIVGRYSSQIASAPAVTGLWDLSFRPGRRTIFQGTGFVGWLSGTTPVKITAASYLNLLPGPVAKVGDYCFFPGQPTAGVDEAGIIYAGSLRSTGYSTGTITCTSGSAVITGSGTTWVGNVDAGSILYITTGTNESRRLYCVKSVDSNTQITLTEPINADETIIGAGMVYQLQPWWTVRKYDKVAGPFTGEHRQTIGGPAVAAVGNKLWVADGERRVFQSRGPDPTTGLVRPQEFDYRTDYHEFPSKVVALAPLRDRLLVFCQDGLYVVSGCALDIVDAAGNPQQRIERISDQVIVRSAAAVCVGSDYVVAAARDGCYRIDSLGTVEELTRSIRRAWSIYVSQGATGGMPAIYRGHLFLPMAAGTEALVCRVDRPQQTRIGVIYPWTRHTGYLGSCRSFAVKDPDSTPVLIGGTSDGYVGTLASIFDQGTAAEANGVTPQVRIETREVDVADGGEALVRDLGLDYTLAGGTVGVKVAKGEDTPSYSSLSGSAPANTSTLAPYWWAVNKAVRRVSFEITTSGSPTLFVARGWRLRMRPRGRRR